MSTENIEPVAKGEAERRAALQALALGSEPDAVVEAAQLARTGREVYCGGDVPRLLVKTASTLGWGDGRGNYQRCEAIPGDVVLLTKAQADRLDGLGVTVDPATDLDDLEQLDEDGLWTDEQVKVAKAGELVAYVTQNPGERARVRVIEEARKGTRKSDGPRVSVLSATEPTPEADAAAELEQAARKDGATATEVADANQGNDAPGSSPTGAETVTT